MSLNVGELVAYLRMDMRVFEDGVARAQTMADKLDGKDVDVKVKADTAVAEEKLAAVAASEDKVDEGNKKIAKSGNDAGRGMGALVAAVLLLGPALVPIAAGAAGLAVGLGAMGAAGVLAIVGIVQEMKKGTALGLQYSAMMDTLKGDLTVLGATASTGVLGPFQRAVDDLQTKMPALNGVISDFSVITGKTAGVLVSGLVAAFIALAPLARDAGAYILNLSDRFAAMMSGPGVVTFGDYVRSVFPQVMQSIESIVGAVFHLVAGIAPLGLGTLGILQVFADLLNAIPTEHLATLVQLASSVYIGFEAFKLLSGPLGSLSTALQGIGVSAETAAVGVRALTIAASVIGAIITVATLVYSAFADSQRKNTQAANDFADAIRQDNGALGENTRAVAVNLLQKGDALAAARQLGISLSTVTDAALGNADAMAKVTAVTQPAIEAFAQIDQNAGPSSKAIAKNGDAADKLTTALGGTNTELKNGIQSSKDLADATASSTAAITPAAAAQDALAAKIGTTSAALVLATAGQKATADAASNATAKMYVENDAAGLLKQSLDLLNGKALNAAQAQNSFDSSLANMGDHVTATGKQITFTTTSIGDMSAASVALRGQLNGQITNLENVAEANRGAGASTDAVSAQLAAMRQQIIDNATAHGVDKDAVTAYIDKLLAIPATVPPTKLEVDKADADAKIADLQARIDAIYQGKVPGLNADSHAGQIAIDNLQAQIDGIHGKDVAVTVNDTAARATFAQLLRDMGGASVPFTFGGHALGGLVGHAGGGLISGPGTGTSDSILGVGANGVPTTWVSKDEFVVNAAATAKHRAELEAINSGKQGPARGNGGTAFNVASMTVVGYNPDEAVAKFGRELAWAMMGRN